MLEEHGILADARDDGGPSCQRYTARCGLLTFVRRLNADRSEFEVRACVRSIESLVGQACPLPGTPLSKLEPRILWDEVTRLLVMAARGGPISVDFEHTVEDVRTIVELTAMNCDEHFALVARDVTDRVDADRDLRRAHRQLLRAKTELEDRGHALAAASAKAEAASRVKGEFLANMSHEIRTPLNGVMGMLELLGRSDLTPRQRRQVETARSSARLLRGLVDGVLDFAKLEAGKAELESLDFDPVALIHEVCESFGPQASAKGLSLKALTDEQVPRCVIGDPTRLRQIVMNLVANAIKFTDQGGVMVRTVIDHSEAAHVALRVSVTDTGIGIAPDRVHRLFNPFTQADASTTRRFGGTGLGLAICAELATLMNGRIGVESEPGIGSTFWVVVTLRTDPAACPDPAASRILVLRGRPAPDFSDLVVTGLDLVEEPWPRDPAERLRRTQRGDLVILVPPPRLEPPPPGSIDRDAVPAMVLMAIGDAWHDETLFDESLPLAAGAAGVAASLADLEIARAGAPPDFAAADHAAAATGAHERRRYIRLRGARVLLVEDNAVNREVAVELLELVGLKVDTRENGEQAVAAVTEIPFDAVLMDGQMPVMDGYTATRRIRVLETAGKLPRRERLPIFALTAGVSPAERQLALRSGMDGHIPKPIEPEQLYAAIASALIAADSTDDAGEPDEPGDPDQAEPPDAAASPDRPSQPAPPPAHADAVAPPELDVDLPKLLSRCLGRVDLAQRLLQRFAETVVAQADRVRALASSDDLDAARLESHALKGAASNLSAVRLQAAAARAEHAFTAGDPETGLAAADDARDAAVLLADRINDLLDDLGRLAA